MRFNMTNVTKEIHRVHPKQFLTLCYLWCKMCIYLASRLALSPNRPKRASTWASSPRSTIGCVWNDFQAVVRSAQIVHLSRIKVSTISKQVTTWASSPRSTIGCIPKWFLLYVWRKLCTYLALTLTMSPNGLKRDTTWPISPRRFIGCIQNDFWAYGTFGANRAPILCQD
jgi:hypothetical protein